MDYSIIVIGDELLIGQVTDTNSGWIARHLTPFGWNPKFVKVIGDNAEQITQAIDEAFAQTDCVLMTGGLGPTKDDITKPTLCRYFGGSLVLDEPTRLNVMEVVNRLNLKINDYTARQALVPTSCRIIQNQVGTAPIMWFEKEGKVLVSLPGVPFETETMMKRSVIHLLTERFPTDIHICHRTFIVVGYPESDLAIRLNDYELSLPTHIHLAYLPQPGLYIRLRLTGTLANSDMLTEQMDTFSRKLTELLGSSIICYEDKPTEAILGDVLTRMNLTLSTAESCTGGNIAHRITSVAGSSQYFMGSVVAYDNSIKSSVLHVPSQLINDFGAVSEHTVRAMVNGVCDLMHTQCAIATSGIAGPGGGTPDKPVGTVWVAAKYGNSVVAEKKLFFGNRAQVIERATTHGITLLLRLLLNL